MKRSSAPFTVLYWHPRLRAYRSRDFQLFGDAERFVRARRPDAFPPALLNHLGHVWTGNRDAQGRAIWTTEAAWAEAA